MQNFLLSTKDKVRKLLSRLGLRPLLTPPLRVINSIIFKLFFRRNYYVFIEHPVEAVFEPYLALSGFIVSNKKEELKSFVLHDGTSGSKSNLASFTRFDLKRNFPYQNCVAFAGLPLLTDPSPELHYTISFFQGDIRREHSLIVKNSGDTTNFLKIKEEKLKRIKSILQCPITKSENLKFENDKIFSDGNDFNLKFNSLMFDFLPEQLRKELTNVSAEKISSMDYYENQEYLIEQTKGGLVLDHGCGLKKKYHPEVVYYDIMDYPTTDVRGTAQKLPFRNNSFDAVISHAVLEHIKDPFECAREMLRVLKPGGVLNIAVAFLQPLHGYPHHYYNMTLAGLMNLFGDRILLQNSENGHPLYLLSWFIGSYLKGLPKQEQKQFLNSKIKDFEHEEDVLGKSFALKLSESAKEELATWYTIKARKL